MIRNWCSTAQLVKGIHHGSGAIRVTATVLWAGEGRVMGKGSL